MSDTRLSFVVPARNEEALIAEVLEAIIQSIATFMAVEPEALWLPDSGFEVIVADDGSEDSTASIVSAIAARFGVRLVECRGRSCASARNAGARASKGKLLCFVDADTVIPPEAVDRILWHHERDLHAVVLYNLKSREPGLRAWLWWKFWGLARELPLARAKSMPAFMSCTRAHFDRFGPFDERVLIAEEWPLTCAAYRDHTFAFDRKVTASTSSRRMDLQRFGYVRTLFKWVAVVFFPWARTSLDDRIRHKVSIP